MHFTHSKGEIDRMMGEAEAFDIRWSEIFLVDILPLQLLLTSDVNKVLGSMMSMK